jgi:hypothetical protein
MTKSKSLTLWIISLILMAGIVMYQMITGPTFPKRVKMKISGEKFNPDGSSMKKYKSDELSFKLPRSSEGTYTVKLQLDIPDTNISADIKMKRFRSYDAWTMYPMKREKDNLTAEIPHQEPGGKVMYQIFLNTPVENKVPVTQEPVILRFRGDVPIIVVIIHLIFMFGTFTIAIRTGLEALFNGEKVYKMTFWTAILLFVGGLISGPIMQKFAFDAYWTGWPFGHDLTDNKTVVGLLIWIIAAWQIKKHPERKWWAILATVVLIGVYLIPHSLLGSEIDYTKLPK